MRKLISFLILTVLLLGVSLNAHAQARTEPLKPTSRYKATFAGFTDYPPFGTLRNNNRGEKTYIDYFDSAFMPFVSEALEAEGFFFESTNVVVVPYRDWLNDVIEGKRDILFGAYHDTKMYKGLEYVMPALISNSIMVIMLPERIDNVKSVNDLAKLKGAIGSNEKLTDYVAREIKKLNVTEMDNQHQMFEKLFNEEIDYILSGHYTGMMMTAELGLREYVAFSKTALWTMPMFLGVSKYSQRGPNILKALRKASEKSGAKERVKKDFDDMIRQMESRHAGKVPPEYVVRRINEQQKN